MFIIFDVFGRFFIRLNGFFYGADIIVADLSIKKLKLYGIN